MAQSPSGSDKIKRGEPVSEAARRVLAARLSKVWRYAKRAAKHPEQDIEYVHRLRVSARRADAALEVFERILPSRESRRVRKLVRQLRRAAGTARDLDVLGSRIERASTEDENLAVVLRKVKRLRHSVQKSLIAGYKKAKRKRFRRRSRQLVRELHWHTEGPEPRYDVVGRATLVGAADGFFAAASSDLSTDSGLHQMRIQGKQLRYTMELFAEAFASSFRDELYQSICEIQDRLGIVNDHATAIQLVKEWLADSGLKRKQAKGIRRMMNVEESDRETAAQQFRDWWTDERAVNLQERFAKALAADDRDSGTADFARDG